MSELSNPGDPLVLADGTMIDPETGGVVTHVTETVSLEDQGMVVVPTNREAVKEVTEVRRRLVDLPEPPDQMNIISVVVAYHMSGLSETDISMALRVDVDQVRRIQALDAYQEMKAFVIEGIKAQDAEDTRRLISDASTRAAQRVAALVDSESDIIALSASKDVLDRAGHRPADVVEHRHRMDGDLRIRYIRDSTKDATAGVTIDAGEL